MSNGSVERLSTEEIYPRPRQSVRENLAPDPPPHQPQPPMFDQAFIRAQAQSAQQAQERRMQVNTQVLAALNVIALLASARLLLLLAVGAGFWLAILAAASQTIPAIAVLVCWCILIVAPIVWLDIQTRRPAQFSGAK